MNRTKMHRYFVLQVSDRNEVSGNLPKFYVTDICYVYPQPKSGRTQTYKEKGHGPKEPQDKVN